MSGFLRRVKPRSKKGFNRKAAGLCHVTVLKLHINNCVTAALPGGQGAPLEKGSVPRAVMGPLLEFGKGKAIFCSKGSTVSSLVLERGSCRAVLKELQTVSVPCLWQPRGPLSLVLRTPAKRMRNVRAGLQNSPLACLDVSEWMPWRLDSKEYDLLLSLQTGITL